MSNEQEQDMKSSSKEYVDELANEVRLVRAKAPNRYHLASLHRWRWDVVTLRPVDGRNPGVKDCRQQVLRRFGYTFTRGGAMFAIERALRLG